MKEGGHLSPPERHLGDSPFRIGRTGTDLRLFPAPLQDALWLPSLDVVMETQHVPTSPPTTASGHDGRRRTTLVRSDRADTATLPVDVPSGLMPATQLTATDSRSGTITDVQRHDNPPTRAAAAAGRAPPGMLGLSIQRRGSVIDLDLSGDLDMATAPRLGEAMAWLRVSSGPRTTIVIDTSDVDFVAAAGYRALQAALVGPNGLWDPRVALIVGPAVARLEAAISASVLRRPATGKGPVGDGPAESASPLAHSTLGRGGRV
jgi:hypothetical protein